MNKWFGKVGYAIATEKRPGIWQDVIQEREYFGDVIKHSRQLETTDEVIDDIAVTVSISIVADPFAYNNFHTIKYVEYMGSKWKVRTADPQYPRIVLTLGGLYNNGKNTTGTTDSP